jgi:hypothetical protein
MSYVVSRTSKETTNEAPITATVVDIAKHAHARLPGDSAPAKPARSLQGETAKLRLIAFITRNSTAAALRDVLAEKLDPSQIDSLINGSFLANLDPAERHIVEMLRAAQEAITDPEELRAQALELIDEVRKENRARKEEEARGALAEPKAEPKAEPPPKAAPVTGDVTDGSRVTSPPTVPAEPYDDDSHLDDDDAFDYDGTPDNTSRVKDKFVLLDVAAHDPRVRGLPLQILTTFVCRYANRRRGGWLSPEDEAEQLGASKNGIKKAIKVLLECGYLEVMEKVVAVVAPLSIATGFRQISCG